ncbi:MAG: shikimate dehydrogenase [Phycisphaerae bacterium]|nr:shikimate dehydrogenase [Phycisphaerae bacterium]
MSGSNTRLICPLTASSPAAMREAMTAAAERGADTVECRLDLLTRIPTDEQLRQLLADPPVEVIATCRPTREGGRFEGNEARRLDLLARAADLGARAVDIEIDAPPQSRPTAAAIILSHHDFQQIPADLDATLAEMEASTAAVNKIAFAAAGPEDALRALDLLRACKKPTIALAMGQAGAISRILAKKFGAYGTFAALAPQARSAPGQPTIEEFRDLYRWDSITPATAAYGVIGCPVAHSMSPAIHNAAFAAADLNAVYVPVLIEPGADNFNRFMDALLERPWMDWRGLSVTIPHKENALAYVGAQNSEELAVKIGAVNTITISPAGGLRGDNTDYAAAIDALCGAMGIGRQGLAGRNVAVLGAGGVARAVVAALVHYQAQVTIYNRTVSRGEKLAEEFGARAASRRDLGGLEAEIVINCTSIGMHPNVHACALAEIPPSVKVVFDTVYNPVQTQLLIRASAAGCKTVSGLEMFLNQAVAQFEAWTQTKAPRQVMRQVVVTKLQI